MCAGQDFGEPAATASAKPVRLGTSAVGPVHRVEGRIAAIMSPENVSASLDTLDPTVSKTVQMDTMESSV